MLQPEQRGGAIKLSKLHTRAVSHSERQISVTFFSPSNCKTNYTIYFFPFLCFPCSFSSYSLPSLLLFLSSIILTSTSRILSATQLLLYTPLPSYPFLFWLQPNNESPKPFQLSMWGRSGHAPLGSPGVAFYCRDCFEAPCSGTWAANGVRSCQRGAALPHMPSHHTCLALPYLTASLSQFVWSGPLQMDNIVCCSCLLPISWTRRAEDALGPCLWDRQMAMLPSCIFILLSPTHILGFASSSAHPN